MMKTRSKNVGKVKMEWLKNRFKND